MILAQTGTHVSARLLENVDGVFVKHISTYYAESYDKGTV